MHFIFFSLFLFSILQELKLKKGSGASFLRVPSVLYIYINPRYRVFPFPRFYIYIIYKT